MHADLAARFNDNVERYRQALIEHACTCDWETFKTKAGHLFDYVEVVEASEMERRFFAIFNSVLIMIVAFTAAIVNMDTVLHPDLERARYAVMVLDAAGICYELYSYMTFRAFMIKKSIYRKLRKDRFVKGIERDFRQIDFGRLQQVKQAA